MPLPKLNGKLPLVGQPAPSLRYVGADRATHDMQNLRGSVVILLTVLSVDTGTCAKEARTFNERASELGATIITNSMDLPPSLDRFCAAEGIKNVQMTSDYRFRDMFNNWGVGILEGPWEAALARAVWVLDKDGVIRYHELVPELGNEHNYEAALQAAKELL